MGFLVVDPSQPMQQSDTEMLAVPKELALLIQEIVSLYTNHDQVNIIESLKNLISAAKDGMKHSLLQAQTSNDLHNGLLQDLTGGSENASEFLKSWDDIFNIQVYIDTDIYGELDPRPPALTEVENDSLTNYETIIQHTEATEAYVQSWKEVAQSMSSFPDDLFTRLWTTMEIAKILDCSPSTLRRSRRNGRLPIRIKNMLVDCISHDGKRSLWFVRPG